MIKSALRCFVGCTEDSEFPAWIIIVIILGALLLLGILVLIGIRIFMELRVSAVRNSNAFIMFYLFSTVMNTNSGLKRRTVQGLGR